MSATNSIIPTVVFYMGNWIEWILPKRHDMHTIKCKITKNSCNSLLFLPVINNYFKYFLPIHVLCIVLQHISGIRYFPFLYPYPLRPPSDCPCGLLRGSGSAASPLCPWYCVSLRAVVLRPNSNRRREVQVCRSGFRWITMTARLCRFACRRTLLKSNPRWVI